MAGFDNEVVYGKNGDFTSVNNQNVLESNGLFTDGQIWIGTTAVNAGGTHINVGTLTSPNGTIVFGYSTPNITADINTSSVGQTITGDTGGPLSPSGGNWNIITTATSGTQTTGVGNSLTVSMLTPYADGDFEFRSSVSGATRVLSVTNTSNTASSQAQITTSVAGTTAGDTWIQHTVGTTRSYAQGIDNSDSQHLKLTMAAGATVNPSTATPIWAFTPTTGFLYDVSGTSGLGIGLGMLPDANFALSILKTQNATTGITISNASNGASAASIINFASDVATNAIGVPSSAATNAAVRSKLYLNGNGSGSEGIVYDVGATKAHSFYTSVASGVLAATITSEGYQSTVQSAFLAYLASTVTNVTGDTTSYTLGVGTALTEVFDQGGDLANATFTSPVTSRFFFTVCVYITGCTIANAFNVTITTSNRTYTRTMTRTASSADNSVRLTIFADMDVGDTAIPSVAVAGEAAATADVFGSATVATFFAGQLEV